MLLLFIASPMIATALAILAGLDSSTIVKVAVTSYLGSFALAFVWASWRSTRK